jgi:hypothetical protein
MPEVRLGWLEVAACHQWQKRETEIKATYIDCYKCCGTAEAVEQRLRFTIIIKWIVYETNWTK